MQRETRINEQIRAHQVRLIGPNGEQLGVLPIREALAKAAEHTLDLVEVAPTANPPVCKIMDFGRYKYEQAKRDRDAHRKMRAAESKGMRLSPKIGEHDFQVKVRQVHEFLKDGNKVRVAMWFRGREMAHPKVGEVLLQRLAQQVADVGVVERMPMLEGRNMIMILTPRKG
ncbi:MAG: translation initiation factor IF-3 [Armatimonadetes bacterium]|nr:translation initiation factor IF-3 [Armatimonadota bacterium]